MNNLSLIPLEDLIDELKQRSDVILIGYVKELSGRLDVRLFFNDPIGSLGLAHHACKVISREIEKAQSEDYA